MTSISDSLGILNITIISLILIQRLQRSLADFTPTQCGSLECGKNAICHDGNGLAPQCVCKEGYMGLPHEICFKSCHGKEDCNGHGNKCEFHDPYFPPSPKPGENHTVEPYYYPYAHSHCFYDCEDDYDCGINAFCSLARPIKSHVSQVLKTNYLTRKRCQCSPGYEGLPYLKCVSSEGGEDQRADLDHDLDHDKGRCESLIKSEGMQISCIDLDGTEHNCIDGGLVGTSAMLTCKSNYTPEELKWKYHRMKCGLNHKWIPFKPFKCQPNPDKSLKPSRLKIFSY